MNKTRCILFSYGNLYFDPDSGPPSATVQVIMSFGQVRPMRDLSWGSNASWTKPKYLSPHEEIQYTTLQWQNQKLPKLIGYNWMNGTYFKVSCSYILSCHRILKWNPYVHSFIGIITPGDNTNMHPNKPMLDLAHSNSLSLSQRQDQLIPIPTKRPNSQAGYWVWF